MNTIPNSTDKKIKSELVNKFTTGEKSLEQVPPAIKIAVLEQYPNIIKSISDNDFSSLSTADKEAVVRGFINNSLEGNFSDNTIMYKTNNEDRENITIGLCREKTAITLTANNNIIVDVIEPEKAVTPDLLKQIQEVALNKEHDFSR